jgi:hypothetical protein
MTRRLLPGLLTGALAVALWFGAASPARAQAPAHPGSSYTPISPYFYYPYWFFPHNYWPSMSPAWPGPPNVGYHPTPPPAYMAYPPLLEPTWRYEFWQPQPFHRGFHFWLDQL